MKNYLIGVIVGLLAGAGITIMVMSQYSPTPAHICLDTNGYLYAYTADSEANCLQKGYTYIFQGQ